LIEHAGTLTEANYCHCSLGLKKISWSGLDDAGDPIVTRNNFKCDLCADLDITHWLEPVEKANYECILGFIHL